MSYGTPQVPVTKYRSTIITLNDFAPSASELGMVYERLAKHIGQGVESKRSNVVYHPNVGWQLEPYQFRAHFFYERTAGQGKIQTVADGLLTVADGFEEANTFAQKSLTGVTYTGAPSQGAPMVQKRVSSSGSFNTSLAADEAAFPGPTYTDIVHFDRIALTTSNHEPTEAIKFAFYVPAAANETSGRLLSFYFCGPAGSDGALVGTGRYCVSFFGDGMAELQELGAGGVWKSRFKFQFAPAKFVRGAVHFVDIVSDAFDDGTDGYRGRYIVFYSSSQSDNWGLISTFSKVAEDAIKLSSKTLLPIYQIPRATNEPVQLAPNRVDIRRDIRAHFAITKMEYPTSGSLEDEAFSVDFEMTDLDSPFTFEWYAFTPEGTTVDAKLYDASTGVELTSTTNFVDQIGGSKDCTPNQGQRHYYVKFEITSDGSRTPTIKSWRIYRDAVIETPDVTPEEIAFRAPSGVNLPLADLLSVSIDGPSAESADESARLSLNDYTGDLADTLLYQTRIPITVETTYDAGGTNRAVLFRGYVDTADAQRKAGDKAVDYADKSWHQYDLNCVGEWKRLMDALAPKRFTWMTFDYDTLQIRPAKITRMIYLLLRWAGYPASMIDVPDLDIRLFSLSGEDFVTEQGTPVADIIAGLARDYLGGWMIFDPSAGTYGKWRLILPAQPPYNILAKFDTRHPGDGKLATHYGSYGTETSGSQTIQKTFVARGTFTKKRYPPEGNIVTVYGSGIGEAGADAGSSQGVHFTATRYNPNSANFAGLAPSDPLYPRPGPSNPDYIGHAVPIKVLDASLNTQEAVDWVCNRVFDYACVSREHWTFDAPLLLVTDANDAEQLAPRPLRFYDAVQVFDDIANGWKTFLVLRCTPSYKSDQVQMASYEVVSSSTVEKGPPAMPSLTETMNTPSRMVLKAMGFARRQALSGAAQKQFQQTSAWMALPEKQGASIQVTDTASPHFGEAMWMAGFHAAGSSINPIGPL